MINIFKELKNIMDLGCIYSCFLYDTCNDLLTKDLSESCPIFGSISKELIYYCYHYDLRDDVNNINKSEIFLWGIEI